MRIVRYTVDSEAAGDELEQVGVIPENSRSSPPLVLLLHGRGSSPEEMLSNELFAALRDAGRDAPAVALVNGGESSYWHDRDSGDWGTYVMEEALPAAVERLGASEDLVAIGGISMG